MSNRRRWAIIGTGGRSMGMFAPPLLDTYSQNNELAGLVDHNPERAKAYNGLIGADIPVFTSFDEMAGTVKPDGIIVAVMDSQHAQYVIDGLESGMRVYVEKPLCTTAGQCRDIIAASGKSSGSVFVTHNKRYMPFIEKTKQLIDDGAIGRILSIEYTELLDRNHGADYFRRWHRIKANSGGLLVHKSSHDFDLINWFAGALPKTVSACGGLMFYGSAGPFHNDRCKGCPHAHECDFHADLSKWENLQKLYGDVEEIDGYIRDGCVFDPSIDIEDHASVRINYENGVLATYTMTAFSGREGFIYGIEGTGGRIEMHSIHGDVGTLGSKTVPGQEDDKHVSLTLYTRERYGQKIDFKQADGMHGGADPRLHQDFFALDWNAERPQRMACMDDGIQAVLVGIAANRSMASGNVPVKVQELLKG